MLCITGLPLTQMIVARGQPLSNSQLSTSQPSLSQPTGSHPPTAAQLQQAANTQEAPHQPSHESGAPRVRAHGDGLSKAVVGQPAQLIVDSKDSRGDLHVTVEGTTYNLFDSI